MSITAAEVNKLRKQTGGHDGLQEGLTESNGDYEAAIEIHRKKGQKVASKRSDREAGEGAILSGVNASGDTGVVISLNCETDFVAKNGDFVAVAQTLLDLALAEGVEGKEDLLAKTYPGASLTVADKITEEVGKIGGASKSATSAWCAARRSWRTSTQATAWQRRWRLRET